MPEYIYIINDPSTHPDLAWNEVVISSGVYDTSLLLPLHNVDIGPMISGYNRVRVVTKYLDMTSRKPASYYHGALAHKDYKVSSGNPVLQSPRAPSLTSRVKTGGNKKRPNVYTPKKGQRCKAGYTNIDGKCVLIMSSLHKSLMY